MKKDLDNLKKIITEHRPELKRRFKVTKIGIFGSYARGTAKGKSDLDILVKLDTPIGYLELAGLKNYIEDITGLKSDVVTIDGLRPEFRDNVNSEVIFI